MSAIAPVIPFTLDDVSNELTVRQLTLIVGVRIAADLCNFALKVAPFFRVSMYKIRHILSVLIVEY